MRKKGMFYEFPNSRVDKTSLCRDRVFKGIDGKMTLHATTVDGVCQRFRLDFDRESLSYNAPTRRYELKKLVSYRPLRKRKWMRVFNRVFDGLETPLKMTVLAAIRDFGNVSPIPTKYHSVGRYSNDPEVQRTIDDAVNGIF
jgi:hypothetical protein